MLSVCLCLCGYCGKPKLIQKGQSRMDNPETMATLGTQDTRQRQSRDTGNIGYTRHKTKTIQRHWQHWVHKTQDKDKQSTKTQHRKLKR